MTAILRTLHWPAVTCTTVNDSPFVVPGIYQQIAKLSAGNLPSAPNGARDYVLVITGRIANVSNIHVYNGNSTQATCEVTLGTADAGTIEVLRQHVHRIQHNSPPYAAPGDRGHPFCFVVRRDNWTTNQSLTVLARVYLMGATVASGQPQPAFEIRELTISAFEEGNLGAARFLTESYQPASAQVLNTFAGSTYGTPNQLRMSANPFPFRITLTSNCAIALTASDTIQNAASSPTKTATVTANATTAQSYIELGAVTGGPWTPGDPVYKGATQVGTVSIGVEKWLVLTSVAYRPRSYNHLVALWHGTSRDGSWGLFANEWGKDKHGGIAKDRIDTHSTGEYRTQHHHGSWAVVTIENGTTTLGLKGLNLYDPATILPAGQAAGQFVRWDFVAAKLTGLPVFLAESPTLLIRYYGEDFSQPDQIYREVTFAESRPATVFSSALPFLPAYLGGRGVSTFVRHNDGVDRPATAGSYVGTIEAANGYPEGLPDLRVSQIDLTAGLNTLLVRGRNNPKDGSRILLQANLADTAKASDVIQNAVSGPTKTAVVQVAAGTSQNYIDVGSLTGGAWTAGESVFLRVTRLTLQANLLANVNNGVTIVDVQPPLPPTRTARLRVAGTTSQNFVDVELLTGPAWLPAAQIWTTGGTLLGTVAGVGTSGLLLGLVAAGIERIAYDSTVAMIPHDDAAEIYAATALEIPGPRVPVVMGNEAAGAGTLPVLTIHPTFATTQDVPISQPEIRTLTGYVLSWSKHGRAAARRAMSWQAQTQAQATALESFMRAAPRGIFVWADPTLELAGIEHASTALRTFILDGTSFRQVTRDGGRTWSSEATVYELRHLS